MLRMKSASTLLILAAGALLGYGASQVPLAQSEAAKSPANAASQRSPVRTGP